MASFRDFVVKDTIIDMAYREPRYREILKQYDSETILRLKRDHRIAMKRLKGD